MPTCVKKLTLHLPYCILSQRVIIVVSAVPHAYLVPCPSLSALWLPSVGYYYYCEDDTGAQLETVFIIIRRFLASTALCSVVDLCVYMLLLAHHHITHMTHRRRRPRQCHAVAAVSQARTKSLNVSERPDPAVWHFSAFTRLPGSGNWVRYRNNHLRRPHVPSPLCVAANHKKSASKATQSCRKRLAEEFIQISFKGEISETNKDFDGCESCRYVGTSRAIRTYTQKKSGLGCIAGVPKVC
jgi:hypothetical protein